MPEQHLDHAHVDAVSSRCVAKQCRSVCGDTRFPSPAASAAMWQTRLSWRVVIGSSGSRPGNSQPCERHCSHHCAQQLQQLRREHAVPVLAALALLDADQHALGVDIADAQHHDLADAQARAIGDAQAPPCTSGRAGCRLEQPAHLLGREHARQLLRVVHAGEMAGQLGAVRA